MNTILLPYLDCPALTRVAVDDCLNQTIPGGVRLLLIDNGSQDEGRAVADVAMREHHIPGIREVLAWHHDPPFPALAGVWNRALEFVWACGEDYALVVNNDVRLHRDTYAALLNAQQTCKAWFVTGVGVRADQFDPALDLWEARGTPSEARNDGVKPEGFHYGGPDFSCYVITRECHRWFQFDEGFMPAYHEDNDFHRRLQLAGFGEKIFGLNVPFLHYGSGTLNENPQLRAGWAPRFAACQEYYRKKWGGLPGSETHSIPFDGKQWVADPDPKTDVLRDFRVLMTGQGKPPYPDDVAELFDGK